jgi:EmrB/QacA subfamily drug resistance transporter
VNLIPTIRTGYVNASLLPNHTGTSKRTLAVTGVMMVIFLFAIDATIVSTSMPTIVAKLGGLELYSWVFSIYMLSSALTTPVFGKLADLFSKRRLMLSGIAVFLAGSVLCGAAQSMEMMIGARALQGLGGGAIYALSFIIVGILYPAEQRARMQGIISGIWGVASILGPLGGGIIVQYWSWRWVFFVNIPLIALATPLIIAGLKEDRGERRQPALDLAGAGTLLLALLLIFYALARSAHTEQPLDLQTILMIAAGVMLLVFFYYIERRAPEPIIPLDLFRIGLYRSSTAVATLCAMGVFGAISYLPLYLQGVSGMSAWATGLIILVLSMGWTAGSVLAGQGINRLGYRAVAIAGMALLAFGYLLLIMPHLQAGAGIMAASALAIGVGMGLANLTTLVAAQTSVAHQRIGVATSTVMLFRTFGGAFAVSLLGTVMLAHMQTRLAQLKTANTEVLPALWEKLANPQNLLQPDTRAEIPDALLTQLVPALDDALWRAFAAGFGLMLIGIAAACFMAGHTPANTPRPKE